MRTFACFSTHHPHLTSLLHSVAYPILWQGHSSNKSVDLNRLPQHIVCQHHLAWSPVLKAKNAENQLKVTDSVQCPWVFLFGHWLVVVGGGLRLNLRHWLFACIGFRVEKFLPVQRDWDLPSRYCPFSVYARCFCPQPYYCYLVEGITLKGEIIQNT